MTTVRPAAVSGLPTGPGVYRFRDGRGRVLYLGRATSLRHRVGSYWGDLGDRRHLARMVPRITRVEAVTCDSAHEAAWLERNLLERSLPPWNRTRGGQEVPVYLRLDTRPGSPGLSVAHAARPEPGVGYFGPYLGGVRARLAAAAVERVLPLGYVGTALTGTGRDLARVRGIDGAGPAELGRTVAAVLDRDPEAVGAVRDELTRRRDAAATGLAFEFAARLQAEIEALEWTVAEQKVTVDGAGDADVAGWAAGLLVRFEIRDGRMCRWRQTTCGEPAARAPLAATPPGWRPFARRNAELAARLAR